MIAKVNSNGNRAILLKPMTYMNLSGEALVATAQFYKIPLEDVVVICDDLDSRCGRVRLRATGSAGGHNGLKNIILKTGTLPHLESRSSQITTTSSSGIL